MADTKELAQGYTAVNNTQQGTGLFLIERLKLQKGDRVLDVGCGPGNLTTLIADIVGEAIPVVGIDPSEERIALAQNISRPKLSFSVGRAEELHFPDTTFDVVYVNSTFHWVGDQPKALHEFARVLKPGGRVGISGGSGDFVADHERIKADVLSRIPFRDYPESSGPKFLKQADLARLLDDAGFDSDIVINKIVKQVKTPEEMIEWLDTSSSGKTYGGIPLELRPKAKQEMIEEWKKLMTKDGIKMDMELLVTVAKKRLGERLVELENSTSRQRYAQKV